jgi:hypothetical protein
VSRTHFCKAIVIVQCFSKKGLGIHLEDSNNKLSENTIPTSNAVKRGSIKDILIRITTQLRLVKNLFSLKSPHFSKNEQT